MSLATSSSHIDNLPAELLAQIFQSFLPPLPMDLWAARHSWQDASMRAPSLLSAVSRRWRDITQSTPRLWCTLVTYFNDYSELQASIYRLETCICRSGDQPLTLFIYSNIEVSPVREEDLDALPAFLHRHAHRLQHLQIEILDWELFTCVMNSSTIYSSLESVVIRTSASSPLSLRHVRFPYLRHFSGTSFTLSTVTLPRNQLTVVELRGFYVNEMYHLLKLNSVSLRHYSAITVLEDQDVALPESSITVKFPILLPDLETLDIDLHPGWPIQEDVLLGIIAPNLRRLCCLGLKHIEWPTAEDLSAFLGRSGTPVLEMLVLGDDSDEGRFDQVNERLGVLGRSAHLMILHVWLRVTSGSPYHVEHQSPSPCRPMLWSDEWSDVYQGGAALMGCDDDQCAFRSVIREDALCNPIRFLYDAIVDR